MVRRTDMMNTTMMNHTKNTPKVVLKTDMNYDEHYSCTKKTHKKTEAVVFKTNMMNTTLCQLCTKEYTTSTCGQRVYNFFALFKMRVDTYFFRILLTSSAERWLQFFKVRFRRQAGARHRIISVNILSV